MFWKEYEEFVKKIDRICAKPYGFELKFKAKPWDTGALLVRKSRGREIEYVPATFEGSESKVDEFVACVQRVAGEMERDVVVRTTGHFRPKGVKGVFVYLEKGRAGRYPEVYDIEEAEEYLEKKGLL